MLSAELGDIWTGQGVISLLARHNFAEGIEAAMTFRNIQYGADRGDRERHESATRAASLQEMTGLTGRVPRIGASGDRRAAACASCE